MALACSPISGLPAVHPGDDLGALIAAAAPADLAGTDLIVVAHKVVSKAEGRLRRLDAIEPGARALALAAEHDKDPRLVQAVLDESTEVLRADHGVLIVVTHHGFVCANAGIDQSNVGDDADLVLLPIDPDVSARRLRGEIEAARGVRPAVVVSDSFGRAWRMGQTDVAIGAAGLQPIDEWAGRLDGFGRELRVTSIAIADAAAGAADLARSKDSREPAVLIRGLERYVSAADGPGAASVRRPAELDLFR